MVNKFEKRLKDEVNLSVPDLKDEIKQKANIKKQKQNVGLKVMAPIFAVMVLVAIIVPIFVISPNTAVPNNVNSYTLAISVNPSVEIKYNKNDVVTDVSPLNHDGFLILQSTKLKNLQGKNISEATNLVIDEMNALGYFNKIDEIKISVKNDKGDFENAKYNEVKNSVEQKLQNLGIINKNISQMTEEELDKFEDILEDDIERFYSEFKEDVKEYLQAKQPIINGLLDDIFAEVNKLYPNITDKFDKNSIKNIFKDNESVFVNETITNLINNYNKLYDEFDLFESFEDFYEVYEDILEEVSELNQALTDIQNGKMPDDVDDIIEDLLEEQTGADL